MTAATVGGLLRRSADWLDRQSLAPTSLTGACLALGICAGAWFTAGTRSANLNGALALAAGYVAALAARQAVGARRAGWLAALGERIGESAVYAGLAIGATAQGWGSMWSLAIAVLSLVAIRATMTACSRPADPDLSRAGPVHRAVVAVLSMPFGGQVLLIAVAAPVWGARASLLGLLDWAIIAVGYGTGSRAAVRRRARRPAARASRPARAEPGGLAMLLNSAQPAPQTLGPPGRAEAPAGGPGPRPGTPPPGRQPIQVLRLKLNAPPPGVVLTAESVLSAGGSPVAATSSAAAANGDGDAADGGGDQYDASERRTLAMIMRCRDDGVISVWFGKLVRGQLIPLPPALLALAAVAMLARLGLRDLPGLLILAPAIVMLVAAPGSSHRHDGRFDWLVPAVLQGAQYIYIVALGFASGVPIAATFALCAVVALRYADLGSGGSPAAPPWRRTPRLAAAPPATTGPATTAGLPADAVTGRLEPGAWLGWEGRMIVCGLGAAMGIATFAYLALAAYLGVLICWKVMTSSLVLREGDYR